MNKSTPSLNFLYYKVKLTTRQLIVSNSSVADAAYIAKNSPDIYDGVGFVAADYKEREQDWKYTATVNIKSNW